MTEPHQQDNAERKRVLRRRLRQARRALSRHQQRRASHAIVQRLCRLPAVIRARSIALYWPNDGEVDTRELVRCLPGKCFYLPVLPASARTQMQFLPWQGQVLRYANHYAIPEPTMGPAIEPLKLDLVLMPLVGFDPLGARLGMGGGFYDRTFARLHRLPGAGPALIGIAHELQKVDALPTESWDIPLAGIVTEQRYYPA
ncbi:5-formyltetrahydrofolate cyclo-ligase [Biformimicrobium ophioploci]|uniref:5-formyltetrahydrofolate cyclo-ligase n=1 Tax=Biformimicrobium ophioploci TaxID=3036711 RepID=A0ABQ6M0H9_9GAMM|nr:5-formyltetrahydrofolate cyclo-ligase [Microbulbifer sp. NKW57]GMG87831.1 5-formyltetrahydrofolate cyclo-ligase [Microbulbifer sp. NKW57]